MTLAEAVQRVHNIIGQEEPSWWRHDKRDLMQLQLDDLLVSAVEHEADCEPS